MRLKCSSRYMTMAPAASATPPQPAMRQATATSTAPRTGSKILLKSMGPHFAAARRRCGVWLVLMPASQAADHFECFLDALDRVDRQALDVAGALAGRIGLGHDRHGKAELGGFAQALLPARRRPHLAG